MPNHNSSNKKGASLEVLAASFKLGVTSFGGPTAHLGYFREEYVVRRKWMDDREYADLVALCQFLPGPASSQVGIGVGLSRAGLAGAIAAWIGFTLPSAILLFIFAMVVTQWGWSGAGWIHGLKLAAIAIVAQAVWGMFRTLAPDPLRASLALGFAAMMLLWPWAGMQVGVILISALVGWFCFKSKNASERDNEPRQTMSKAASIISLSLFAVFLVGLPILSRFFPMLWLTITDVFYRAGALVFGGGHVVLPLLQSEIVGNYDVSQEVFIAGYGAAQAVPGPLFTFASYVGAVLGNSIFEHAFYAVLALVAIFLPSFFLVIGVLPYWGQIRQRAGIRAAMTGVHTAVIGILLAALFDPLWLSTVVHAKDIVVVLLTFACLAFWKLPPWLTVVCAAIAGQLIYIL